MQEGVVVLAAPLDRPANTTACCHSAMGRVGVSRLDAAIRPEDLADVFREIPAVGVPGDSGGRLSFSQYGKHHIDFTD